MIGYLGFDDAYHRLLGVAYGERALLPASICKAPDGQFCVVLPDPCLTLDEARAAKAALLLSLRAGDNVGFVMVDGIPQRLPFLNWYRPAYWAVPPPDTRQIRTTKAAQFCSMRLVSRRG